MKNVILIFLCSFLFTTSLAQKWGVWYGDYNKYEDTKSGIYTYTLGRDYGSRAAVKVYIVGDILKVSLLETSLKYAFTDINRNSFQDFYFYKNGSKIDKKSFYFSRPNLVPNSNGEFLNALFEADEVAWKLDRNPNYFTFSLDGFEDAVAWLTGRKTKAQREAEERQEAERRKLEQERLERERLAKLKEDKRSYAKILNLIKSSKFNDAEGLILKLNFRDEFPYWNDLKEGKKNFDIKIKERIDNYLVSDNYDAALKEYLNLVDQKSYTFDFDKWKGVNENVFFDFLENNLSYSMQTSSLKKFSKKYLSEKYGNETHTRTKDEVKAFIEKNKSVLTDLRLVGTHEFSISKSGTLEIDGIASKENFKFAESKKKYRGIEIPVNSVFNLDCNFNTSDASTAKSTSELKAISYKVPNRMGGKIVMYNLKNDTYHYTDILPEGWSNKNYEVLTNTNNIEIVTATNMNQGINKYILKCEKYNVNGIIINEDFVYEEQGNYQLKYKRIWDKKKIIQRAYSTTYYTVIIGGLSWMGWRGIEWLSAKDGTYL